MACLTCLFVFKIWPFLKWWKYDFTFEKWQKIFSFQNDQVLQPKQLGRPCLFWWSTDSRVPLGPREAFSHHTAPCCAGHQSFSIAAVTQYHKAAQVTFCIFSPTQTCVCVQRASAALQLRFQCWNLDQGHMCYYLFRQGAWETRSIAQAEIKVEGWCQSGISYFRFNINVSDLWWMPVSVSPKLLSVEWKMALKQMRNGKERQTKI